MKYYPIKNEKKQLLCRLTDLNTNRETLKFYAQDVSTQSFNFSYVSGVLASTGQGRTIYTDYDFPFDVRTLVEKQIHIKEIGVKSNKEADYVIQNIGFWDDVRLGNSYGKPVRHVVLYLV